MGLEIVALGLICTMRFFPETAFARLLQFHLVEQPMARLSKLERHHLLFLMIAIAMLFAGSEIIAILGSADMAFSIAWDMSFYFDAVAVTALVTAARQIRIAVRLTRSSLSTRPTLRLGRKRRSREVRSPAQSRASASANDDDPHREFALAA
jgi:hypothetical protein